MNDRSLYPSPGGLQTRHTPVSTVGSTKLLLTIPLPLHLPSHPIPQTPPDQTTVHVPPSSRSFLVSSKDPLNNPSLSLCSRPGEALGAGDAAGSRTDKVLCSEHSQSHRPLDAYTTCHWGDHQGAMTDHREASWVIQRAEQEGQ